MQGFVLGPKCKAWALHPVHGAQVPFDLGSACDYTQWRAPRHLGESTAGL